jgi:hypothetical protein
LQTIIIAAALENAKAGSKNGGKPPKVTVTPNFERQDLAAMAPPY